MMPPAVPSHPLEELILNLHGELLVDGLGKDLDQYALRDDEDAGVAGFVPQRSERGNQACRNVRSQRTHRTCPTHPTETRSESWHLIHPTDLRLGSCWAALIQYLNNAQGVHDDGDRDGAEHG
jgi:hypothetical protein